MHNNGLQLTKAARCAPFAVRWWGQSLRAAFAAEPGVLQAARHPKMMEPESPASSESVPASPEVSGYKPKAPLWQSSEPSASMRRPILGALGVGLLTLVAFVLDSQLFSPPALATSATIEAIEGFLPADPESQETVTYVLRLSDGSQARMTSPMRHSIGTSLVVMVSYGRLSGRKLVSSTYVVSK